MTMATHDPLDAGQPLNGQGTTAAAASSPATRQGRSLIDRFASAGWVAWVWGAHGLAGVVAGLLMIGELGATNGTIRFILGMWLLLGAGATAWRWWLDERRSPLILLAALVGTAVAIIVLLGSGFSLDLIRWVVGIGWIATGALELAAWGEEPRAVVQGPWVAALTIFIGIVAVTLPIVGVPILATLAGIWTLALGLALLGRWLWLSLRGAVAPARGQARGLTGVLRVAIPALLLAALGLTYTKIIVDNGAEATRQSDLNTFYQIPNDLAPGAPGGIVRAIPLTTAGVHGHGWRIIFRSEDQYGRPTVSSGVIYAPSAAGSNRLVVAWAHGTVGLAPQCAPSRQEADGALVPWVNDLLDRNWVVTAPDYVGAAGTGQPATGERYLIGAEQARDLLNSVRAAVNITDTGASTRFAIYGHSQGGLVALTAAALAPTYAKDLTLVAAGAASAASDLGAALHERWQNPLVGWLIGSIAVFAWTHYYPDLDANAILSDAGRNHYQELPLNSCLLDPLPALINPRMGAFFGKDPTTVPAWRRAFIANQAPLPPANVPIFIAHGLADTLIDPAFSTGLVGRYCAAGANVVTKWMPGVGHGEAAIEAAPTYAAWLSNITNGQTPSSDCAKPLPVAPAAPLTP
jgi:pimeloyl-ACP methyl ester carboxylesterase/uncharacterized membrane protein HdeD (DUF308 family)